MNIESDVYFVVYKDGRVWKSAGQLKTETASDIMDIMMILLTNAVRLGLSTLDIERTLKPFEKAMISQMKDIIKVEAKEIRARLEEQNESAQQQQQKDA